MEVFYIAIEVKPISEEHGIGKCMPILEHYLQASLAKRRLELVLLAHGCAWHVSLRSTCAFQQLAKE
jgi:hypothetical protein